MTEYIVRFLAGGLVVSAFALLGDVLKPKSFAGLFGAAPSVALVSLALAYSKEDSGYVFYEARSMIIGAAALSAFCVATSYLLKRDHLSALSASLVSFLLWLAISFGLLALVN